MEVLVMPRTGRVVLPGFPHHVVQRGHNRQVVFAHKNDYSYYLDSLVDWKEEYGIRLYGYCLMTNHVHLIIEPETESAMGQFMKRLAGRQTRYVNRQKARSGTLWEGRYKSSPIDTDNYLLACCRYVDLNPVRAQIVSRPENFYWSSYRERIGLDTQVKILDNAPDAVEKLPETLSNHKTYARYVSAPSSSAEIELIREALKRGQLTGGSHFIDEVEGIIGRRIERRGPGRIACQGTK